MVGNVRQDLCKRVYAPPYKATGVQCYVFILKGKADTIQVKVIDPMLVGFKPWNFQGWGRDLFVVAWFRFEDLVSTDPADRERGAFAYNESLVFSLVESPRNAPAGLDGTFLHIPCLYLNKFVPIVGGREVFGMPKSWGDVLIPKHPPGLSVTGGTLSTDAEEILTFQSPPERPKWVRMMEAYPSLSIHDPVILERENSERKESSEFIEENLEDVREAILETARERTDAVVEIYRNLALQKIPQLFLKQPLSSAVAGTTTCPSYVRVTSHIDSVRRLKLLRYRVRLGEADSAPLARSYGVACDKPLKPLMAYWLQFNFTMGIGREIPVADGRGFGASRGEGSG